MEEESQTKRPFLGLPAFNWPGLAAGVLMLILPFMGAWWQAEVGDSVLRIALSPFYYEVMLAGQTLTSDLVGYFIIAAKLSVFVGGILMIVGSLTATKWWGRKLVRWGAMRVLWMLVALVAILIIGAFFMNRFLPSLISGMVGNGGEGTIELALPYLVGTGSGTIQIEQAVTISAPVTESLTSSFWLAILTAILGVGARIYHGRLLERLGISEEED